MLSRKCFYALHALIFIATVNSPPVQVRLISRVKKIPRKFLEVIMLDLKKAHIVESKQGKGGGYFLAKSPQEITLLEIINIIDGGFLSFPCLSSSNSRCQTCTTGVCLLHEKFSHVFDESKRILTSASILDFVDTNENWQMNPAGSKRAPGVI